MKNLHYCIICLLVCFLFAGCDTHDLSEISTNGSASQTDSVTSTVAVTTWNPYEGDVIIQDTEMLPLNEMVLKGNKLCFQGAEYVIMDLPTNKVKIAATSGWKIHLTALTAKWRTSDGYIVLVPDDRITPPLICTYEDATGKICCYLRTDISDGGVEWFDIDSFDTYFEGDIVRESKQSVEKIWRYHVSDEELTEALPMLDGEWEHYSLMLVYKDCPALQYELNFAICNDLLYIEKLSSGNLMSIPVNQIELSN